MTDWMNAALPSSDRFTILMSVSKVMEKRFTKEQIEEGAKVNFFSVLASDEELSELDALDDLKVEWIPYHFSPTSWPNKLLRVYARIGIPTTNQEGSSA
jgi:hypothetical protein